MPRTSPQLPSQGRFRTPFAFTLVEMLVAVSVLALLIALVARLTDSASLSIANSDKRIDSDSQARLVFTRMEADLGAMLNRKDVDCFFVKNTGAGVGSGMNDAMYFYSDTPGYFSSSTNLSSQSNLSFVGYRIANHLFVTGSDMALYPDNVLERVSVGMLYEALGATPLRTTVTFLAYSGSLPNQNSTIPSGLAAFIGADPTWDGNKTSALNLGNSSSIIAEDIFRMEFCFQVKDPTKFKGHQFVVPDAPGKSPWSKATFSGTTSTTTSSGAPTISMRQINSDVSAVVVTIAVLDTKSRVIVSPTQLAAARTALPDGDDPAVAKTWVTLINDGTFRKLSNLPVSAASQVRVYQRWFPLKNM